MIQRLAKIDGPSASVQVYTHKLLFGSPCRCLLAAVVLLISTVLPTPSTVDAQSASTGIIQGTVLDDSTGEPLAAVNVVVEGTPYGSMTNADGFYLLRNIPTGEHTLMFSYVGYRDVHIEKVVVLPSLRTVIDTRMEPAPVEMPAVVVTAERALIQKDLTGTLHRVGSVAIESLPVDNFQEIVELQPGVVYGGHIRGGRAGETVYIMDGVPVQDPSTGEAAVGLPKSVITELNVHTGGFDAEFGNALSGVVHIITRRGGNSPEAMVRYDRDDLGVSFDGTEHSGRTQLETQVNGPIVRDRAFYLVAADLITDNTRWWQDLEFTTFDKPYSRSYNIFARSDVYFSPTLRASAQALMSSEWSHDYEWRWRFNLGGLPAQWRDSNRLALTLNHMITPYVFYDLQLSRFNIQRGVHEGSRDSLETQPLWEYDSFLQYVDSGQRLWWFRGDQTITTGRGALTAQAGRHRIKVGFDLAFYSLDSDLLKIEPQTTFYGLPLPTLSPLDFSSTYSYAPRTGALFAQHMYETGEGFVVKFGLRYDWLDPRASRPVIEWIPTTSEEFQQEITDWVPASRKSRISPRIGLATPIDPQTYFLFNYGEFFQVPLFDQLYSGLDLDLTRGLRVLVGNPDLQHQRTKAYEFSFRREFNPETAGSLTYFFKESFNLIDTKTFLASDSRALEDGYTQYVNLPLARSSGVELAIERRPFEGVAVKAAYTYMFSRGHSDTGLSGLNYLQWGFEPPRLMHYLSWDQRHTLAVEARGTFRGTLINVVARYNSPRPYTYAPSASGILPEGTWLTPNGARMRDIFQIDARLSHDIPFRIAGRETVLRVFGDVRNLTDRKNIVWISSDGKIGGELGDPAAYRIGRRTRIGIEVMF